MRSDWMKEAEEITLITVNFVVRAGIRRNIGQLAYDASLLPEDIKNKLCEIILKACREEEK